MSDVFGVRHGYGVEAFSWVLRCVPAGYRGGSTARFASVLLRSSTCAYVHDPAGPPVQPSAVVEKTVRMIGSQVNAEPPAPHAQISCFLCRRRAPCCCLFARE